MNGVVDQMTTLVAGNHDSSVSSALVMSCCARALRLEYGGNPRLEVEALKYYAIICVKSGFNFLLQGLYQ